MPRILLLGPPGSGKGTQAARIIRTYGIPAISTGDALRGQLAAGSPIGLEAKSYMDAGKLVPDEIIIEMVRDLFEKYDTENGFLMDGFPRTIAQAEMLDDLLAEKNKGLEQAFFLKVPKDELMKRLAGRLTCPSCGLTYNLGGKTLDAAGCCEQCGKALIQRDDDKASTVEKRIEVFEEQTRPLIEYYNKQGILVEMDGTKDIETLQKQIDMVIRSAE